jgi:hypothetical protein
MKSDISGRSVLERCLMHACDTGTRIYSVSATFRSEYVSLKASIASSQAWCCLVGLRDLLVFSDDPLMVGSS